MNGDLKLKAKHSDIENGSLTVASSVPSSPQCLLKEVSLAQQVRTPEPVNEWDVVSMSVLGLIRIPFGEALFLFGEFSSEGLQSVKCPSSTDKCVSVACGQRSCYAASANPCSPCAATDLQD